MSVQTYTKFSTKKTSQREKIPGSTQVPNSAGGFAWKLDMWGRLDRFLVMGTEGGTYYIGEQKLTKDNANNIIDCVKQDGIRVVNKILEISLGGRAAKNDPAIFALAIAISLGDEKTRQFAAKAVPEVCRIGTHLFHFATYAEQFRGWGRLLKSAVAGWYTNKTPESLAYQAVKYRQRDGWSHRDLLRLSHPQVNGKDYAQNEAVFDWIAGVKDEARGAAALNISIIKGYEAAQIMSTPIEWSGAVREYNLPREALPTEALKSKEVWEALLEKMPMTAMIRNLGNMTKNGVLTPMSEATATVVQRLNNQELITKARVHPFSILVAMSVYESGFSIKGSGMWTPVTAIVDALDGAFYKSFGNVVPSNKRTMLALDVSGSMNYSSIEGTSITAMKGAAAMAMITAATEPNYMITAFAASTGLYGGMYKNVSENPDEGMRKISISPRMRLDSIVKSFDSMSFGGTDCALPMIYALKHNIDIDTFVIYTDSETWAGGVHPTQALKNYRQKTGIDAKLIVVGMTASNFTIADPTDAGMLDVVGFDTATPQLISNFSEGF